MDVQGLIKQIEIMREELTYEYEKCIDSRNLNPQVLEISRKLDELIVIYMKSVDLRLL